MGGWMGFGIGWMGEFWVGFGWVGWSLLFPPRVWVGGWVGLKEVGGWVGRTEWPVLRTLVG